MDDRLNLFWNELIFQCEKHNKFDFIYKIEYWGILWMPWSIYIDDESLKFSANDINENDLQILISIGAIEFIEELAPIDTIDLKIKRYRIKNHSK